MKTALPLILLFLTGCFQPSARLQSLTNRAWSDESRIQSNNWNTARSGVAAVNAAAYALTLDHSPDPAVTAAADSLQLAQTAFDTARLTAAPDDFARLRAMVDGLVSTNADLRHSAEQARERFNRQLSAAEQRGIFLAAKLADTEARLEKTNRENAALADTWLSLKHWLYAGIAVIAFMFLVRIGWAVAQGFALFNPAVAVGVNTARLPVALAGKAFASLVAGGEAFKQRIKGLNIDRKSTRLNSSHVALSRMPSSA